jgi:UDPglucose 6-dehydrogenase
MRIGIFGLGKLGLCSAACFAARGHRVMGFDTNPERMAALKARRCPVQETGLEDLLPAAWPNFTLADDPAPIVWETDLSLIIVPTPSQPDGRFSNHAIAEVLSVIGPALGRKDNFHVVNVVSTVMPGSCEGSFQPLLEELSGKTCGTDFGLVYNPEFIALGSVIHNFLNPDLVLIGSSDERSGSLVKELYQTTCDNAPQIAVMSLINAEITKLSLNCFVTMKISFANELAAICEQVPGAEADVITAALGADTRIGPKYLKGGLGFGGPCFPRDNLAFQVFAREAGWEARLAPQVVSINDSVVERVFKLLRQHLHPPGRVALLGLAYKPGTHLVEESQSLQLAQRLLEAGYTVKVHDPQAMDEARSILGDGVIYCWAAISFFVKNQPVLVDCWGILKGRELPNFRYVPLGCGPRPATGGSPPWADLFLPPLKGRPALHQGGATARRD